MGDDLCGLIEFLYCCHKGIQALALFSLDASPSDQIGAEEAIDAFATRLPRSLLIQSVMP